MQLHVVNICKLLKNIPSKVLQPERHISSCPDSKWIRASLTNIFRGCSVSSLSNNDGLDSVEGYIFHRFHITSRTGLEGHISDPRSMISIRVYAD